MPLMLAGITLATSAAAPPPQKVPEVKASRIVHPVLSFSAISQKLIATV